MSTTLNFKIETTDFTEDMLSILNKADEAVIIGGSGPDNVLLVRVESEYVATLMRALDLDADEPGAIRQFIYNNRVRLA
jgi:hypothetical protein